MTTPQTLREQQIATLTAAIDALRALPRLDRATAADTAIREAQRQLAEQRQVIETANRPELSPEFQTGRTQNCGSGEWSLGLYYRFGHVPANHDGYVGHLVGKAWNPDTRALEQKPNGSYPEGDTIARVRHEDAFYAEAHARGLTV